MESICFQRGIPQLLDLHEQRIHRTQIHFFNNIGITDLSAHLRPPEWVQEEALVKCRLVYHQQIVSIEWEVYHPQTLQHISLVHTPLIEYRFKYKQRDALDNLFAQREKGADDIVIIHQGMVSDGYYANLVLETKQGNLYTPDTYLLQGVKKTFYQQIGILTEKSIRLEDLSAFYRIHFINAMLDLGDRVMLL